MKLVKENLNFERGLDPKEAMGVGGMEILANFKKDLRQLLLSQINQIKSLEGKTISGKMNRATSGYQRGYLYEVGHYTFTVQRVLTNYDIGRGITIGQVEKHPELLLDFRVWLYENENVHYEPIIGEKIYIK